MIAAVLAAAAVLAGGVACYLTLAAWSMRSLQAAREDSRSGTGGRFQYLAYPSHGRRRFPGP